MKNKVILCIDCNQKCEEVLGQKCFEDTPDVRSRPGETCTLCRSEGRCVTRFSASMPHELPNRFCTCKPKVTHQSVAHRPAVIVKHEEGCEQLANQREKAAQAEQARKEADLDADVVGHNFMRHLQAAGVVGPQCEKAIIEVEAEGRVTVYTKNVGDGRLLQVDFSKIPMGVVIEGMGKPVPRMAGQPMSRQPMSVSVLLHKLATATRGDEGLIKRATDMVNGNGKDSYQIAGRQDHKNQIKAALELYSAPLPNTPSDAMVAEVNRSLNGRPEKVWRTCEDSRYPEYLFQVCDHDKVAAYTKRGGDQQIVLTVHGLGQHGAWFEKAAISATAAKSPELTAEPEWFTRTVETNGGKGADGG